MTAPAASALLAAALALTGCIGSSSEREQRAAEPVATRDAATVLKDTLIASDVKASLITHEPDELGSVAVGAENGVVTLRGVVRTAALRERAVELTQETTFVRRVVAELRVDPNRGRPRRTSRNAAAPGGVTGP